MTTKLSKDELDLIISGLNLLRDSALRQTRNAANNDKLKSYHQEVADSVTNLISTCRNKELPL